MSGFNQLLFAISGQGPGIAFLEANRLITSSAFSTGGDASAGAVLSLSPSGLLSISTFANGDFTDQSGEGNYMWLQGGSSSLYSYRYSLTPSTVPGFSGPPRNIWTPIGDGFNAEISCMTTPLVDSVSADFVLTLELALTVNTSNILATGQFEFQISASTTGTIAQ